MSDTSPVRTFHISGWGFSFPPQPNIIINKLRNERFLEKNLNDAPMLGAFVNQSDEIKVEGFELIKVEERDGKQAINARELHKVGQ